ncbi:CARDB domain-containing protein, partial [Aequorivita todarodis]|uniref:CARDB domain-containing protein n=1 Tax=Aequorivita todarodis TaxID=2036821 RepID=UPI00235036F2
MKKLILLFLFFLPLFVFSQANPITEFRQFNGRYQFTALGNTLNTEENPYSPCVALTQSSAQLNLGPGQTFLSAHLYWAGSGTGDFDVKLNGIDITPDRIFPLRANTGLDYFSAYKDVTNIVAATGNGTYTLSELDVNPALQANGDYCLFGTNFAGWSIIVIYEDPSLRLNQITLFDGLEYVNSTNQNINIVLGNINASTDIASKIGFLAWEGDANISITEELRINSILIDNPPLNPSDNAFNGTNSYTNSSTLYNMDLDYYELESLNIIQPGDTQIDIQLRSGQDFIMVNNVIVGVNSELPDATIEIDNLGVLCQNNNIDVDYTVYNVNSTSPLPANTPIAFYADAVLIGQTTTNNIIPIGGSESGTITLNIPIATPNNFNLRAVVDDIGDGTGIVAETDESNNEFIYPVDLSTAGILLNPGPACLGRPVILDSGVTDPPFNIQWFRNGVAIPGATNPTLVVTLDGIYSVEAVDGICRVDSNSVVITFRPQPIANPPVDLYQCDYGTTAGVFNLTDNDANILGGQDPALFTIKYYQTYQDSFDDTNEILGGVHIIVPPSPQTIYARIEDNTGSCFDLTDFKIYFSRAIAGLVPVSASYCDADGDGGEWVDLAAEFNALVLDGEPSSRYNITYHG